MVHQKPLKIILSCEHAGCRVPNSYKMLFSKWLLHTHRGYDPGAFDVAKILSRKLKRPLTAHHTTRLLVDVNRTLEQETLFSSRTKKLPRTELEKVMRRHYWPYWEKLKNQTKTGNVLHISVHSFTPVLKGSRRLCDIGLLYATHDKKAQRYSRRIKKELLRKYPNWIIKENEPYTAEEGGIVEGLRGLHRNKKYSGLYIEVNQRWAKARATVVAEALSHSIQESLVTF